MDNPPVLIALRRLSFGYPGGHLILRELDFEFKRGMRIGLVGPNGSGKTTLFHIIMGLLPASSGAVEIFGRPRSEEKDFVPVRQKIGLLFQDADDQLFSPTVIEDVAFGPLNLGKSKEEALQIARRTLKLLGLEDFEERVTHKMSGGEKRLVSLATVLSMEPQILLLDEPTTGLDERTKARLADLLKHLDLSYIVISHEFDFLSEITDSVYAMEGGQICTDPKLCVHQHVHAHAHGKTPHKHQ